MIKLPKEIAHMIKTIEDAGFEAYAVGGCVRDSILGRPPGDWDLTSNASREILTALFPDASIVNKKLGVMRITAGKITADIAAYRIDGVCTDYRRPETVIFTEDLGEDLRRRDFTMNAIAVSPERGLVDPYHGTEDIKRKLIRGIGDPRVRFEEDALRILRGVRFAAQLDFEIDGGTLEAMKENVGLLEYISTERIREEFIKTITAPKGGNGLKLFLKTGAMPYILGRTCMQCASEQELNRLALLAERIDRTAQELSFRLALVYLCFCEQRAYEAIETLGYSNEMKKLLQCAVSMSDKLDGIRDKAELKCLIGRIGMEYYRYLDGLSIQRAAAYQLATDSIQRRTAWLEEIRSRKEALFLADLAIGGNDLIKAGIAEGTEIGRILNLLLEEVHRAPEINQSEQLLKFAERIR